MRKFTITLSLAAIAVLLASGCATTTTTHQPDQPTLSKSQVDQRYIQAVERQARRSGVMVRWVNPPRSKRVEEENAGR